MAQARLAVNNPAILAPGHPAHEQRLDKGLGFKGISLLRAPGLTMWCPKRSPILRETEYSIVDQSPFSPMVFLAPQYKWFSNKQGNMF